MQTSLSDTKTLTALRQQQESAYALLYQAHYPMIERMVVCNNGTVADAQDLFQDTLLIFVKQIQDDDWQLTASLKTYLYAIAHRQWLARLRRRSQTRLLDSADDNVADCSLPELAEPTTEEQVGGWLARITAHCQRLIKAVFFQNQPVTQAGSYNNAHTARNQQYKCLQQLRQVANSKPKS